MKNKATIETTENIIRNKTICLITESCYSVWTNDRPEIKQAQLQYCSMAFEQVRDINISIGYGYMQGRTSIGSFNIDIRFFGNK